MEFKIILRKKGDKAVFLYLNKWSDGFLETQFVVGTLIGDDVNKPVGYSVKEWWQGAYFEKDIEAAYKHLG